MQTILIIEDDESLNRGIAFTFEKEGYAVVAVNGTAAGLKAFQDNTIDLIILDLGLPDGNGIDLCKTIRAKSAVPIIMLTARNLEMDEVFGFSAGADDYITKPFSLSILRARVKAMFRRAASGQQLIKIGKYSLDTNLCKLFCEDTEILD